MKKNVELYRTPRRPGYLGAYNWRATVFGLLLLVVVNFAATQFLAAKFQYQPALGAPLCVHAAAAVPALRVDHLGLVQLHIARSAHQMPLFFGEMIVFGGSFLCVAVSSSSRTDDPVS